MTAYLPSFSVPVTPYDSPGHGWTLHLQNNNPSLGHKVEKKNSEMMSRLYMSVLN
jgi:hypothetical protein